METLSDRVRQRIRDEMAAKHVSQRDIAGLTGWSQSRIAKVLVGRTEMAVDELEGFAFALGIQASELIRDRGMEFYAEMTPLELRVLERLRKLPRDVVDACLTMLEVSHTTAHPERHAKTLHKDRYGNVKKRHD